MPIHLPSPPPDGIEIVQRDAPTLLSAAPHDSAMSRSVTAGAPEVKVTQPHRVFSATIDDVLRGRVLVNARETTWLYFLVHQDNEPFAAAEVRDHELLHVNEGPFIKGTADAMTAAVDVAAAQSPDYELRLLRIPALYTVAVWLAASGEDVLIPAEPAPPPLVAKQAYAEAAFTDALRPLAELRRYEG